VRVYLQDGPYHGHVMDWIEWCGPSILMPGRVSISTLYDDVRSPIVPVPPYRYELTHPREYRYITAEDVPKGTLLNDVQFETAVVFRLT